VWELHRFKTHHWVVLGCGKGLGGGGSTEQGGSAAEASDGGVAPARVGRGEVAWELRGVEADLVAGSIEGGGVRRRGFDGEQRRRSSTTVAELEGEGVPVEINRREATRKVCEGEAELLECSA